MEPHKLSWLELDLAVSELNRQTKDREIWKEIKARPLSMYAIRKLKEKGWKVRSVEREAPATVLPGAKVILLREDLTGYERDKVLFHELAHAHFGQKLNDVQESAYSTDNNAIAEWLGRQSRSKFYRLRSAIYAFELKPQIYDEASYQAFGRNHTSARQLSFSFAGNRTVDITRTLRD